MRLRPARHDNQDAVAGIVALLLTCGAFAAILGVSAGVMDWKGPARSGGAALPEHVRFVAPVPVSSASHPIVSPLRAAAPAADGAAPTAAVDIPVSGAVAPRVDSATGRPKADKELRRAGATTANGAMLVAPSTRPTILIPEDIVVPMHNPWAAPREPTEADRLESSENLAIAMQRLAQRLDLTTAERDSLMGVISHEKAIPGRSAQMPGVPSANRGASLIVPFLSPGPSPDQRKRDKIADAEYLQVLERLKARLRQRRDSVLADSIARRVRP